MIVVCSNNTLLFTKDTQRMQYLTLGKRYTALPCSLVGFYRIICDNGQPLVVTKDSFLTLNEYRSLTISEILK